MMQQAAPGAPGPARKTERRYGVSGNPAVFLHPGLRGVAQDLADLQGAAHPLDVANPFFVAALPESRVLHRHQVIRSPDQCSHGTVPQQV